MTSIRDNGEVEFEFFRAEASRVLLCGDFTNWQDRAVPMRPIGRGWWKVTAKLAGGEYRFRYCADGQWFTDYAAYGIETTDDGINSVLVVPHRRAEIKPATTATLAA
jgi:1,4-alpha-glucan branching enzyme